MVIEQSGNLEWVITVAGKWRNTARARATGNNELVVEWEIPGNDNPLSSLYSIAWQLVGMAGEGTVSEDGYPVSLTLTFPSGVQQAMKRVMDAYRAMVRTLSATQAPLCVLMQTLMEAGHSRYTLSEQLSLSGTRISSMVSDPGCSAAAATMRKLRLFIKRHYPSVIPLVDAAESYCRGKLREMFGRSKPVQRNAGASRGEVQS